MTRRASRTERRANNPRLRAELLDVGLVQCSTCLITDFDLIGKRFRYRHQVTGSEPCRAAESAAAEHFRLSGRWLHEPTEGGIVLCGECEITDRDSEGGRWYERHHKLLRTAPCMESLAAHARECRDPAAIPKPSVRKHDLEVAARRSRAVRTDDAAFEHHDTVTLEEYRRLRIA